MMMMMVVVMRMMVMMDNSVYYCPYYHYKSDGLQCHFSEKFDRDRVPQFIYEAECLSSHSCRGMDSSSSLESIPITLKMPVLRKNPRCATFSLEFEPINIACICATSRHG